MIRALARLSGWTSRLFVVLVALQFVLDVPWLVAMAVLAVVFGLSLVRPRPLADPEPYACAAPVTGDWVGLNSPADKDPSHGTHAYGQRFAIDICGPSDDATPKRIGWGKGMRRPQEFSAFGRTVLAVADGVVVTASDGQRDHRSRESWPAIAYLSVLEGIVRTLGGARFVIGNHVIVDHGEGVFSLYAHLRRGSVLPQVGRRVTAGTPLGEVGNSGNTSEPHLHVHLMDDASPYVGRGIPFRWTNLTQRPDDLDVGMLWVTPSNGVVTPGVPAMGQRFAVIHNR